jgi:hypothetical protein
MTMLCYRASENSNKTLREKQDSPSAKNWALGLPRVLHSGKNCTRGREVFPSADKCPTIGEERHSGKAIFPECNTRGRPALAKGNLHLTAGVDGTVLKKSLPREPWSSNQAITNRGSKRASEASRDRCSRERSDPEPGC